VRGFESMLMNGDFYVQGGRERKSAGGFLEGMCIVICICTGFAGGYVCRVGIVYSLYGRLHALAWPPHGTRGGCDVVGAEDVGADM